MRWRNDDAPNGGHALAFLDPPIDVRIGELVDHSVDMRLACSCKFCQLGNGHAFWIVTQYLPDHFLAVISSHTAPPQQAKTTRHPRT